ncbi:hypothetical protein BDV96DRAFT_579566 [Lophiotrema nucula]|uniref:Uncharacterized protein n=1 Tax=Lophiotrema nucula TaxID=690887 RepID=A0A6A5Z0Q3_9PLEO|nr:hypothetical protein BDV96DRAFT_579566 [Lophiotrema nucula]
MALPEDSELLMDSGLTAGEQATELAPQQFYQHGVVPVGDIVTNDMDTRVRGSLESIESIMSIEEQALEVATNTLEQGLSQAHLDGTTLEELGGKVMETLEQAGNQLTSLEQGPAPSVDVPVIHPPLTPRGQPPIVVVVVHPPPHPAESPPPQPGNLSTPLSPAVRLPTLRLLPGKPPVVVAPPPTVLLRSGRLQTLVLRPIKTSLSRDLETLLRTPANERGRGQIRNGNATHDKEHLMYLLESNMDEETAAFITGYLTENALDAIDGNNILSFFGRAIQPGSPISGSSSTGITEQRLRSIKDLLNRAVHNLSPDSWLNDLDELEETLGLNGSTDESASDSPKRTRLRKLLKTIKRFLQEKLRTKEHAPPNPERPASPNVPPISPDTPVIGGTLPSSGNRPSQQEYLVRILQELSLLLENTFDLDSPPRTGTRRELRILTPSRVKIIEPKMKGNTSREKQEHERKKEQAKVKIQDAVASVGKKPPPNTPTGLSPDGGNLLLHSITEARQEEILSGLETSPPLGRQPARRSIELLGRKVHGIPICDPTTRSEIYDPYRPCGKPRPIKVGKPKSKPGKPRPVKNEETEQDLLLWKYINSSVRSVEFGTREWIYLDDLNTATPRSNAEGPNLYDMLNVSASSYFSRVMHVEKKVWAMNVTHVEPPGKISTRPKPGTNPNNASRPGYKPTRRNTAESESETTRMGTSPLEQGQAEEYDTVQDSEGTKLEKRSSTTQAKRNMAVRKVPIFSIIGDDNNKENPAIHKQTIMTDVQSEFYSLFQYANGSYWDFPKVAEFLKVYSPRIAEHVENLERSSADYPSNYRAKANPSAQPSAPPKFRVQTAVAYKSWADVLGTIKFEGVENTSMNKDNQDGDPAMLFRFQPPQQQQTGSSPNKHAKRDQNYYTQGKHIPAFLDMLSAADRLRGLGLAAPGGVHPKRDGSKQDWNYEHRGDEFRVKLDGLHFRNVIKHVECGTDGILDNRAENEETCHNLLRDVEDKVFAQIDQQLKNTNDPNEIFNAWDGSRPAPLAEYLRYQFSSYASFAAFRGQRSSPLLEEKVFQNLKNSLVSKAYADEKCWVRCGTHGLNDCHTGCYDASIHTTDNLYGLDPERSLAAEQDPWNLNQTRILQTSYQAYVNRDPTGYLPGSFDLNPYQNNVREITPVLPVCRSSFRNTNFPCSCGNQYGDESDMFWAASSWASDGGKKDEYKIIRECIQHLSGLSHSNPAAFLVNMCQVFFHAAVPPRTGSHQEHDNKGYYQDNLRMCDSVLEHYKNNKHQSDKDLDHDICRIWGLQNHGHHKAGFNEDFTYVNDRLADHACHDYRHCQHHDGRKCPQDNVVRYY